VAAGPDAPATHRNRDAILSVLRDEFARSSAVLEIGSGTGQHAVYFAAALPSLTWQTSDREENHAGINEWVSSAALDNVLAPLSLDVEKTSAVAGSFDAVFSANTAHIMNIQAVECMFRLVCNVLLAGGVFCLYGPFNQNGKFSSESNERFDQSLQNQDPVMGIRDLEKIDSFAGDAGLRRASLYAMPANNMIVVWRK